MEIADIGGATGVFSYWLAQLGHRVHLLDFTPLHIEQAKEKGKNNLMLASYTCGDARQIKSTPYWIENVYEPIAYFLRMLNYEIEQYVN